MAKSLELSIITEKSRQTFWESTHKAKGKKCWRWSGALVRGYASFRDNSTGKYHRASRISYFIHKGRIPAGMLVLHDCDNPTCVNPDHLFLGTNKDNSEDMVRKGRQATGDRNGARLYPERIPRGDVHGSRLHPESRSRGEDRWNAKLTERLVRKIRSLYDSGHRIYKIARKYPQFSVQTISRAATRHSWKHVE